MPVPVFVCLPSSTLTGTISLLISTIYTAVHPGVCPLGVPGDIDIHSDSCDEHRLNEEYTDNGMSCDIDQANMCTMQ